MAAAPRKTRGPMNDQRSQEWQAARRNNKRPQGWQAATRNDKKMTRDPRNSSGYWEGQGIPGIAAATRNGKGSQEW